MVHPPLVLFPNGDSCVNSMVFLGGPFHGSGLGILGISSLASWVSKQGGASPLGQLFLLVVQRVPSFSDPRSIRSGFSEEVVNPIHGKKQPARKKTRRQLEKSLIRPAGPGRGRAEPHAAAPGVPRAVGAAAGEAGDRTGLVRNASGHFQNTWPRVEIQSVPPVIPIQTKMGGAPTPKWCHWF